MRTIFEMALLTPCTTAQAETLGRNFPRKKNPFTPETRNWHAFEKGKKK